MTQLIMKAFISCSINLFSSDKKLIYILIWTNEFIQGATVLCITLDFFAVDNYSNRIVKMIKNYQSISLISVSVKFQ